MITVKIVAGIVISCTLARNAMVRKSEKRVIFVLLLFLCCVVGPNLTWRVQLKWIRTSLSRTVECKQAFVSSEEELLEDNKSASLLIVQYTDGNTYSALLNLTQPINQAYAEMWGYDYQLFTGLLIQAELPPSLNRNKTEKVPTSRATYNKVMILDKVLNDLEYQNYEKLLILDSDALMYDFSRDISLILPDDRMMLAHKVKRNETVATWNINIGVTLWNLRHIATKPVCRAWKKACIHRIIQHPTNRDSDQTPLQHIMQDIPEYDRQKMIIAIPDELGYSTGRFIRHFIRPDASNWTDFTDTMPIRVEKIKTTIAEICTNAFTATDHPDICNEYLNYNN
jgi:hypothetical protein